MPRSTFTTMKEEDRLGLGVQGDGASWLAEARQMLDFNLKEVNFKSAWQSSEAIVGRIPILQIPARQSLKFELTDLSFTVSIVSIVSIVS